MEITVIILTLAGLAVGGDQFVRGAARIGRRLGMTPILVGATVVAIGTSLPEWAVSVKAAMEGMSEISAGNVVGSNVFNVCIILGLTAMVCPVSIGVGWLPRDGFVMLLATAALLVVGVDGEISRVEGVCLLGMAVLTIVSMIVSGRAEKEEGEGGFRWWDVPRTLISLPVILVSSHFFIDAAGALAAKLGVSQWVIGITVAAVGTSLPELVTALAAAWQRHPQIVVGNLLGSNTMNIFFVLGSAGAIHPLSSGRLTIISALTFAGVMLASVILLAAGRGLSRLAGAFVFLLGAGWYVLETAFVR